MPSDTTDSTVRPGAQALDLCIAITFALVGRASAEPAGLFMPAALLLMLAFNGCLAVTSFGLLAPRIWPPVMYVNAGALFSLLLVAELLTERRALSLLLVLSAGGSVLVLLLRMCLTEPPTAGLLRFLAKDLPAYKSTCTQFSTHALDTANLRCCIKTDTITMLLIRRAHAQSLSNQKIPKDPCKTRLKALQKSGYLHELPVPRAVSQSGSKRSSTSARLA